MHMKTENDSDDFFQSKHINKRKEEYERELYVKTCKAFYILYEGLNNIKLAYDRQHYENKVEELLLRVFLDLHVDANIHRDMFFYGYFILDNKGRSICFYNVNDNCFYLEKKWVLPKIECYIFNDEVNVNYLFRHFIGKRFDIEDATFSMTTLVLSARKYLKI